MRGRLNIEAWLTQFYPLGPSRLTPFQRSRNLVQVEVVNMSRVYLHFGSVDLCVVILTIPERPFEIR